MSTGPSAAPVGGSGLATANEGSLLDLMDPMVPTASMNTAPAGGSSPMDMLDDVMIGGGGSQRPTINTTFVKVPFKPVVQRTQAGN